MIENKYILLSGFWHLFPLIKQPGMEKGRNCYSDEHYLPTFFYVRTIVFSFCVY